MIDIHSHILPGLDDGARSVEEAVAMARNAWLDGITDMIVTPHTHDGIYHNSLAQIREAVEQLQQVLSSRGIPLTLHVGAEIHIHLELVENLQTALLATLCDQYKYVLLELPSYQLPRFTDKLIEELLKKGVTPIIAHPERLEVLCNQPQLLARWIAKGAVAQVTADSLTGKMGKSTKRVSEAMVKNRLVHLLASDAHHATHRRAELSAAFSVLTELLSKEEAALFHENAKAVLRGLPCRVKEPAQAPARKWWFW
ncbi:tyrosine-protein phosphatase [Brevibacillus migulae]|uniref:tyrosine-protein phosphatase n=1 Tax=Brevibacillus migulae TaxID=1644114 RepID=UPI00106E8EF4|nr:CpsB/CapC family capsule biosynthesis tyrosine phosphatase [Brevibacillus migulae]